MGTVVATDESESLLDAARRCAAAGALGDAERYLAQAVAGGDQRYETVSLAGVIAARAGRVSEAIDWLQRAQQLRPWDATAQINLGNAWRLAGRYEAALAAYECASAIAPGSAQAWGCRGNALWWLGRYAEATASYDRAIALAPRAASLHHHRGLALAECGRHGEALGAYEHASALGLDSTGLHNDRGNALRALRRGPEAEAAYERALRLAPDNVLALRNLGALRYERGDAPGAMAAFDRALALDPDDAQTLCNGGTVVFEQRNPVAAIAMFERVLAVQPADAKAAVYRGYAHLLQGDYARGWRDHERRFEVAGHPSQWVGPLPAPRWQGEDLHGRSVLLRAEQALGDTLQFCRYAPWVAARGANVMLQVQPRLTRLLAALPGVSQVLGLDESARAADHFCPLMSLPFIFGTRVESIPAETPYLHAPPDLVKKWSARIGKRARLRVGLAWAGGDYPGVPDYAPIARRRNLPLALLAPLAASDIEFFSLQKGASAEAELAALRGARWPGPALRDLTAEERDLADTAALISHLDLVITVDTSIAHLAGALGKPVWILLCYEACWRWLLERDDSPWYPSARLFRQRRSGDWGGVVERVAGALADWATARG